MDCWCKLRALKLSRLVDEASKGLIDSDILGVLVAFNTIPCVVTVSSCSGRIVFISAPKPGDKKHGGIVAKWHRRVELNEVLEALKLANLQDYVWLSVQPAVLALYVYGTDNAFKLADILVKTGFKYTGVRRLSSCPSTYYVLSMGAERLDVPLIFKGKKIVDDGRLEVVVDMVNSLLTLAKQKLENLKRAAVVAALTLDCDEATLCGSMKSIDLAEELKKAGYKGHGT